jgi:hypothetical protein
MEKGRVMRWVVKRPPLAELTIHQDYLGALLKMLKARVRALFRARAADRQRQPSA